MVLHLLSKLVRRRDYEFPIPCPNWSSQKDSSVKTGNRTSWALTLCANTFGSARLTLKTTALLLTISEQGEGRKSNDGSKMHFLPLRIWNLGAYHQLIPKMHFFPLRMWNLGAYHQLIPEERQEILWREMWKGPCLLWSSLNDESRERNYLSFCRLALPSPRHHYCMHLSLTALSLQACNRPSHFLASQEPAKKTFTHPIL